MFVHLHWHRTIWHISSDPERSLPSTIGWIMRNSNPIVPDLFWHSGFRKCWICWVILVEWIWKKWPQCYKILCGADWSQIEFQLIRNHLYFLVFCLSDEVQTAMEDLFTSGGGQLSVSGIWYFSFGKVYSDMRRFSAAFGHKRPMILHLWFLSWEEYGKNISDTSSIHWFWLVVLKDG